MRPLPPTLVPGGVQTLQGARNQISDEEHAWGLIRTTHRKDRCSTRPATRGAVSVQRRLGKAGTQLEPISALLRLHAELGGGATGARIAGETMRSREQSFAVQGLRWRSSAAVQAFRWIWTPLLPSLP